MTTEFKAWPKTPRPKHNKITITEKMDGTNACVVIEDGQVVAVQSRNRFIKVGDDNFGFASWVHSNADALARLGNGHHFGEWVGPGIQRNPHKLEQKEFFLFNTARSYQYLPDVVKQVPVLYHGVASDAAIYLAYTKLWARAANDKYSPEGIIVLYHVTDTRVKYTFANQDGKNIRTCMI